MKLFLAFLSLTLLLEAPVYFILLKNRPWRERITFWLTANLVSYPPVFFIFPHLDWARWACELGAEIWAPVSEIAVGRFILPHFSKRDMATVVVANLFSWGVGRFLLYSELL